jgi:hypothetical protein
MPAVKGGRTRRMQELVEEVRPEFGDTAKALSDLMNIYKFETLMTLTAEAINEKRTS